MLFLSFFIATSFFMSGTTKVSATTLNNSGSVVVSPMQQVEEVVDYDLFTVYTDLSTNYTWQVHHYYYKTLNFANGYTFLQGAEQYLSTTYDAETTIQAVNYKQYTLYKVY